MNASQKGIIDIYSHFSGSMDLKTDCRALKKDTSPQKPQCLSQLAAETAGVCPQVPGSMQRVPFACNSEGVNRKAAQLGPGMRCMAEATKSSSSSSAAVLIASQEGASTGRAG